MNSRIAFVTGFVIAFSSLQAYACGDSLYRVGRSVSYRTYSAPLPGNLLFYADSESARELASELEASGHGVDLVGSVEELETALQRGGYDVVITPFSQRGTVEAVADADASFLPVTTNQEEEQAAQADGGRSVSSTGNLKQYLRAIHRVLKTA